MKRQLTEEQKQKAEARRNKFRALAKQVGDMSDEARAILASRMGALVTVEGNALSAINTCLIAFQKPDATIVGGFRQWLKAGRCVRKGEHGLMIWIPSAKKAAEPEAPAPVGTDDSASDDGERPRFLIGTVFDVSQTVELDPAAELATPAAPAIEPNPQTPQYALVLA